MYGKLTSGKIKLLMVSAMLKVKFDLVDGTASGMS
jgi:hypothetical protein